MTTDQRRAYMKAYQAANADKLREYQRTYMQAYRAINADKLREKARACKARRAAAGAAPAIAS
jgi:hypothetical protein